MIKFRDLKIDEIDCRVKSIKSNGCVLLLYKNARCDMNILDETVGCENWQRRHYECKGNLFCEIGIYDKSTGQWIWKGDCGSESNTEKEKGEASDSFKRAGFNWGIGRELYTAPFIFANAKDCNIKNGKCYDKFIVTDIKIENKVIKGLTIIDENTNKVVHNDISNYQSMKQLTDNQPPKPKGEQPTDWEDKIKIYSETLASNSGMTADVWIAEAKKKYQTPKAQAEVLLKWCKQYKQQEEKKNND